MRYWARRAGLLLLATLAAAPPAPAQAPPPEEPDFFFLTGGPYTQLKDSFQIIWANQFVRDRNGMVPRVVRSDFVGAGRFEWGFTDRLEFDLEFGYLRLRERTGGVSTFSAQGADNTMLGVRYRLLREDSAPITLTTGPQVILPSASPANGGGLGAGEVSYAWDLALARDFGGPFFTVASVNLSLTPNVPELAPGSSRRFDLSAVAWAVALGLRPLERDTSAGDHHDIHLFLEFAGARREEIAFAGRSRTDEFQVAPAVRYGFWRQRNALTEIGIAFPVGLNRAAPDWGVIVQLQFEYGF
ncbi:MAG: hypothetical protein ACE5H2_04200 [Terriglobia bacterium]